MAYYIQYRKKDVRSALLEETTIKGSSRMVLSILKTTNTQPDLIIHLGAGRGEALDEYLVLGAEKIVLVEADPKLALDLKRRVYDLGKVEVIQAAISSKAGKALLKIFNNRKYNNLRSTTVLRELLPGLRLLREVEVDTISPLAVIETAGLSAARKNWLVINVPGEEATVLKALEQADKLHFFERILLYCGREKLYEGAQDAEALMQILLNKGFDLVSCEVENNPDRPRWVLTRNLLKIENRKLLSQLDELNRSKAEQTKLVLEHQTRIEELELTLAESEYRHKLLNGEMARLKDQIIFMNDLLFQDE